MSVRDFYFKIYRNGKVSFYSERRLKLISCNHPEKNVVGQQFEIRRLRCRKGVTTPLDNQPMTGSIGGTARSRKSQYLTTLYFLGNALLGNPDVCFNELFTT